MLDFSSRVPVDRKVAIIYPLYGYSDGSKVLYKSRLKKITDDFVSGSHKCYNIFTFFKNTLSEEMANFLATKGLANNALFVEVEGNNYGDLVNEGIKYLKTSNLDFSYVLCYTPVVEFFTPRDAVEYSLNYLNRGDIDMISGTPKDEKISNNGREYLGVSSFYWGVSKQTSQILQFDTNYKTPYFFGSDLMNQMKTRINRIAIQSEHLAMRNDFQLSSFVKKEDYDSDKEAYKNKWRMVENIKY